jgi:hypothetical protein
MRIAARTGMHLVAASPEGYLPDPAVVASCREDAAASGARIDVVVDPAEAVAGARVLYTDVWTSMGQEEQREQRILDLERFSLDGELPNRIAIFRRPLEADFDDVDELRDEIRITVLHELGHYFGLDEGRLAELGYE